MNTTANLIGGATIVVILVIFTIIAALILTYHDTNWCYEPMISDCSDVEELTDAPMKLVCDQVEDVDNPGYTCAACWCEPK